MCIRDRLNFVQHVKSLLKMEGRAAVVVPDNVLFVWMFAQVFYRHRQRRLRALARGGFKNVDGR